jgi:hypothetical protein
VLPGALQRSAVRNTPAGVLDNTNIEFTGHGDLRGVESPDFLALGMGATSMLSMIWSVAMGRRAVGVELRGDPSLGVHWNIREDLYHHFGLVDKLMEERYGEEGMPRRGDGRIFRLAECFYNPGTAAGAVDADEVATGFLDSLLGEESHLAGLIHNTEFIDDRWQDGKPARAITVLNPPVPPPVPDVSMVGRRNVVDVLDGPSTFQCGAAEVMVIMRRYLEAVERMDMDSGRELPRVRLFASHRVVTTGTGEDDSYLGWFRREEGFVNCPDGRKRVRIEAVREFDYKGRFRRERIPGSEVIDLGVPELFMIAQGFHSTDAERLGFKQEDVEVDHHDGRGPVVAQADYLAGLLEIWIDGRLRRRIASEFDKEGNEYWVRQIAVGHQEDPEVGWILVQVPDFKTFDPILAGLVPSGTDRKSRQYVAAVQHLMRDFYLDQVSLITELPRADLEKIQVPYGPKLFSLVEKVGADALVAANGVVAGDSFGNGHFMTSGGAITGMIGHASRVLNYWRDREAGTTAKDATRQLADAIKVDTDGWLQVSAQEFSQAVPINFGAERIAQIQKETGRDASARATTIDATRRHRHALVPLDPSDWRRLVVHSGRLHATPLPPISPYHPDVRAEAEGQAMNGESAAGMTDEPDMPAGSEPATAGHLEAAATGRSA